MLSRKYYCEMTGIDSLQGLSEKDKKCRKRGNGKASEWIYRGQGCKTPDFTFKTSLERALQRYWADKPGKLRSVLKKGIKHEESRYSVHKLEKGLIRDFKRHAHHYLTWVPEENNTLEWLALMQHYGAPTRLHDWTHSLYVAAFFAVEAADEEGGDCAVWALNVDWLEKRLRETIGNKLYTEIKEKDRNWTKPRNYKQVFENGKSLVCHVNPLRLNERLTIQQGVFLCQGNISIPFEDNLASFLSAGDANQLVKYSITNTQCARKKMRRDLYRMNMSRRTLYPGLQGFAESLDALLVFPDMLVPGRHREHDCGKCKS